MSIDDPEALAARLVVGDELMAKGDSRGELIVVQCEIERGGFDRARGIHLRKRESELLTAASFRWIGTVLGTNPAFRRGVIDQITLSPDDYVRDEDAIWALAPHLRHVRLHGLTYKSSHWGDEMDPKDWLVARDRLAPALASGRITSLCLMDPTVYWNNSGGSFDYGAEMKSVAGRIAEWLIEEKMMSRFRGLELWNVEPSTLKILAAEPTAAQLAMLHLGGSASS